MRRYTTVTLCITIGFITAVPLLAAETVPQALATVLAGAAAVVIAAFWEGPVPRPVAIAAVLASLAGWSAVVAWQGAPMAATAPGVVLAVIASQQRRHRMAATAIGAVLMVAPVAVVAAIEPATRWSPYAIAAVVAYALIWVLVRFNDYGWGLFLQLDEARRAERELAIVQERYRMAADLHDIQGHTLHVIRLTMQAARRLMPTDPAGAAAQLETAEALVVQTLADTKALVSGDRVVSMPHELANAIALLEAAGIDCAVDGTTPPDADELLALLLRESTTNILRHAQATRVRIELGPHRLLVVNDGATGPLRPGGGIARLAERFEAAGGRLAATVDDGEFRIEGRLP